MRAMPPVRVCLLGDRAYWGGRQNIVRYDWLEDQHKKYGDDRWFDVFLLKDFILNDISNVYFGIQVKNIHPVLFDIWIKTIQLNFVAVI